LKWNLTIAIFFLAAWLFSVIFIIFPDFSPVPSISAFVVSLICFPLFAFYAARYDESSVIPFCYIPRIFSFAKSSLRSDGPTLFAGRISVICFMFLLIWAAVLLAFLNAEAAANDVAIYAYYFLVLGVFLIALSNMGRKEVSVGGEVVERCSIDLRLASAYSSLRALLIKALFRHVKEEAAEVRLETQEVLKSIEEIRAMLDKMSRLYDYKLEEIRKRLDRIEEKLNERNG